MSMTVWPLYKKSPHMRCEPVMDKPPPEMSCRTRCTLALESPYSCNTPAQKSGGTALPPINTNISASHNTDIHQLIIAEAIKVTVGYEVLGQTSIDDHQQHGS